MATVLRYRVFSAIRNASRSYSFLKTKSPNNVRSLATAAQEKTGTLLKNYQEMSIHQCLLLVEKRINTKGRLTGFELDCITQAIQNKGSLQSNQILLLIRCCGAIAMNEKPEVRMVYAQKVWNFVKSSGVPLDITHYNAYLKVQMENEQPISPPECLKDIKKEGMVPNRVTYQYLLIHCCTNGDLAAATELLEEMKKQNYPLNENIFNALVMGHSIVNDISGAEGIIKIMKEKEIFVTSKTYSMFLCGLAVAGNIEKMRSVMEECSKQNIEIRGSKMMDVVYYLFTNDHYDYGEELLKSLGKIQDFSEIIILQFRLLHKKNYEGYLRTVSFISTPDDLANRMRVAFRYLGNKEDFESILKFSELCDKKGLNMDPLRNTLYYCLLSNNSEKALKIIDHMYKSGQPLKETYFAPLLISAAKSGDVKELVQILTALSYRYAFEINLDFLTTSVFDHLEFDEKKMTFLLNTMAIQVNPSLISSAFLKSALRKRNMEMIMFIMNRYGPSNRILDSTLDLMAKYVRDKHDLKVVTDILAKWIHYRNQTSPAVAKSKGKDDVQEAIDRLATRMSRLHGSDIMEDFLKVVEEQNFPISASVVDLIRQKLSGVSADTPETGTSENEFPADYGEMPKREQTFDDDDDSIRAQFNRLRKAGNITELEKLFDENESLQNSFGFRKIVESLKTLNKEDSIKEYLRRYHEKCFQADILSKNLFMEAEMINRGMVKEAVELISKRFSSKGVKSSSSFIFANISTPVFERGNENEIKQLLSLQDPSGVKLIRLKVVIENLMQRGSEATAVKILRFLDEQDLNTLDINRSLIVGLFNKKKFELMDELIKFLEDKSAFKQYGSELMFLYACTGQIAKGHNLLNSEGLAPLKWLRNVSAINSPERMQVLENAIAILRGNENFPIRKIYERLMDEYKMESVNPDKALDLWLKLQEENLQPTPRFLVTLAEILKKNGRDVPFQPPAEGDIANELYVPQSFPWDVKTAIWSLKGRNGFRKGFQNLKNVILENKLTTNHISTVLDMNKNMEPGIRRILENIEPLIKMKKAEKTGTLSNYLENFVNNSGDKSPEVKILELPFQFLLCLQGLFPNEGLTPNKNVSQVVLWAHWQNVPDYGQLAKILEPAARELIKSEELLGKLVNTLELDSFGRKHKHITSTLLAQKVFDEYEHLKKRAEDILNSTEPPSDEPVLKASESSLDDNFSFQDVFKDQTAEERIQSNVGSEKPVEKRESPEVTKVGKRGSGTGPNV